MRVLCLDNSNKPNEIPQSKWELLRKDEWYTVIEVMKCNAQGGIFGYKLAEIDLSGCEPYIYFAAYRFGIPKEELVLQEEEQLML